jgi:guanylate kinase
MLKLLGNLKEGLVFIVSAPAGTGKTTLVELLTQEFDCVKASISCTTRKPRLGEIPGVHYHFLSTEEFEKKIEEDEFLEYVQLYGYYYGTSKQKVKEEQRKGRHVILTIDTQGALKLKGKYSAAYIFIHPPTYEELRKRLINRQTESLERVEERLLWAKKEMEAAALYDYSIVNDDLKVAYEVLRSILIAEEHRVINQVINQ